MQHAICKGRVLPDRLGSSQCLLNGKPPPPILDWLSNVLPRWVWGFFTFYELELSRPLLQQLIQSGMQETKKRNCGTKQCCCCDQVCPTVLRAFWKEKNPRNSKQCPSLTQCRAVALCLVLVMSQQSATPPFPPIPVTVELLGCLSSIRREWFSDFCLFVVLNNFFPTPIQFVNILPWLLKELVVIFFSHPHVLVEIFKSKSLPSRHYPAHPSAWNLELTFVCGIFHGSHLSPIFTIGCLIWDVDWCSSSLLIPG